MTKKLGEVTMRSEAAARALERIVDAAMGLPVRGEGIPIGRGIHTKRASSFTHKWTDSVQVADSWRYPYYDQTKHLVLGPLFDSESEIETVVREVSADDPHHAKSAYLSGVFRRVLSDFEPSLYDEVDFLGVEIAPSGNHVSIWRRTELDDMTCSLNELLGHLGCADIDSEPRHKTLLRIMRAFHRRPDQDIVWFAVPLVLKGPTAPRAYAVGLPASASKSLQPIVGRPEVSNLFQNALEAALFLCSANVTRYIDQPFLTTQEVQGLAPHALVTQLLVGALASNAGGAPEDHLVSVFNDVARRPYEGRPLVGELLLGPESSLLVETRLVSPINFSETKLVRKVLEAQSDGLSPVGTASGIVGFGRITGDTPTACTRITFTPRSGWLLGQGGEQHNLCSMIHGVMRPLRTDPRGDFVAALTDVFGPMEAETVGRFEGVIEEARAQAHGTMLVITANAQEEAIRLASSTTLSFMPHALSQTAVQAFSKLDGALLFDPDGLCHAAGVIVDGTSIAESGQDATVARSRGARYNSAKRYRELCRQSVRAALIAVISEDGYFDLFKTNLPHAT
ncbi:MAG: hypothetical protein Q8Q09_25795 [Deltaproteobacteria bacterium]|nr:hypothetical protein [Deltaproteobacteria bacterium]